MSQKITDCGQTAHDDYLGAGVTDDLIARLRNEATLEITCNDPLAQDILAVCDLIEQLQASERSAWNAAVVRDERIEQLQREVDRADYATRRAVERAERAEAEVQRLRKLLRKARDLVDANSCVFDWKNGGEQLCAEIDAATNQGGIDERQRHRSIPGVVDRLSWIR